VRVVIVEDQALLREGLARLFADGSFAKQVAASFEGAPKLEIHLAPPLLARRDANGHLQKREYGPWMMKAFRALAGLRFLRGTPFDVFGYSAERRSERELIVSYRTVIGQALSQLSPEKLADVTALASIPEEIRGYGHVKQRHLAAAMQKQERLLQRLRSGSSEQHAA